MDSKRALEFIIANCDLDDFCTKRPFLVRISNVSYKWVLNTHSLNNGGNSEGFSWEACLLLLWALDFRDMAADV